jgi:acyl carrier protein
VLVTAPVPPAPEPAKDTEIDKDSLLAFATNWIAKRTGFPESVIASDKRLRDDLNLDSIKVGELVLLMAKRANRTPKGDPAALANATLTALVEAVLQQESPDGSHSVAMGSRQIQLQSVPGLGEWVRTFRVGPAPAPIGAETPRPLPSSGTAVIVGDAESPRANIIAEALRERGLSPVIAAGPDLIQSPPVPGSLAALIVLLPSPPPRQGQPARIFACTLRGERRGTGFTVVPSFPLGAVRQFGIECPGNPRGQRYL